MRKLLSLIISILLCLGLYASATHNESVLRHYILEQELVSAYSGLWPAAKRGDAQALLALTRLAEGNADLYWLGRAASLQSLPAQLALATLSPTTQEQLYWLQQSADNNHAPSQFELYLIETKNEKRFELLISAANSKYQPAIIALGKYLYEAGQLTDAVEWLTQAAEFDVKSRYKLARVQWQLEDIVNATNNFTLAGQNMALAKRYADAISDNTPVTLPRLINPTMSIEEKCSQQLQFVATSLDSLVQAQTFASKFAQDARFENFPICISPLVWLQKDELQCELLNNRQQCNLASFAAQIHMPSFTHLVLFLGSGTAYVQEGVMHLDQADTYSVFVHELAHFVGFVDEYAVSSRLAQNYCELGDAPNLLIKPLAQEELYKTPKFARWQEYSSALQVTQILYISPDSDHQLAQTDDNPVSGQANNNANGNQVAPDVLMNNLEIGRSRTCARLNIETYKPASDITFLEHHDTDNIPDIYLVMWRELLKQNHQQLAVAEAFYNSAFDQEAFEAAAHWADLIR